MQNKDKGDGIEDSPLDMLLVILLDGASKEVVMPSSFVTHLHGVTQRTKLNTNCKYEDHFKHLKKIRINGNKQCENEDQIRI